MFKHYLQPLLAPDSVALVGASEREGAWAESSIAVSPTAAFAVPLQGVAGVEVTRSDALIERNNRVNIVLRFD